MIELARNNTRFCCLNKEQKEELKAAFKEGAPVEHSFQPNGYFEVCSQPNWLPQSVYRVALNYALSSLDKAFGELDLQTKVDLFTAYHKGSRVEEWSSIEMDWVATPGNCFYPDRSYRLAPVYEELTIPWEVLSDDYRWAARQADGYICITNKELFVQAGFWVTAKSSGSTTAIPGSALKGVKPGNKHWTSSLVERPKGV